MVKWWLYIALCCASLTCPASGNGIIWSDSATSLTVQVLPSAERLQQQFIYRVSFKDKGESKQFLDTIELDQPMAFDSAHVYLRQLDGKNLPELVFETRYKVSVTASEVKSRVQQSVFIIWDLRRGREMLRCTPFNTWYVEQTVYDSDGKLHTIYGDCIQQFTLRINDKSQVILTGVKDESSGPAIEHYLCDPIRTRMGVYQLNELNKYEWLKER